MSTRDSIQKEHEIETINMTFTGTWKVVDWKGDCITQERKAVIPFEIDYDEFINQTLLDGDLSNARKPVDTFKADFCRRFFKIEEYRLIERVEKIISDPIGSVEFVVFDKNNQDSSNFWRLCE